MQFTYDEIPPKFKDVFPPATREIHLHHCKWSGLSQTAEMLRKRGKNTTKALRTCSDQLKLTTGAINKQSHSSVFLLLLLGHLHHIEGKFSGITSSVFL